MKRQEIESDLNLMDNEVQCAFIATAQDNPRSYQETMKTENKLRWEKTIRSELESTEKNKVWTLFDRLSGSEGKKSNTIDSRWVLKRNVVFNNEVKYKARLVIRGFKDRNSYELSETYTPVSRLPLIRAALAIINKFDLEVYQLDVKTAFLNGTIDNEIYIVIHAGTAYSTELKRDKICEIQRALYGLKISPKRWYERFTEVALKLNLKSRYSEPCLFTWRNNDKFLLPLLYVDDILIASNHDEKLNEIKLKLKLEFEMSDMGEPKSFLGIE